MSAPGVKAGEEIRTPDVQLGKGCARIGKDIFVKYLWVLASAGAQLGAGRLAGRVTYCHLLAEYAIACYFHLLIQPASTAASSLTWLIIVAKILATQNLRW